MFVCQEESRFGGVCAGREEAQPRAAWWGPRVSSCLRCGVRVADECGEGR